MKIDLTDPAWWHNCSGPEPREALPGWILPRYPAKVREALNPMARWRALDSCGVELRFVTEAPHCRVTLGAHAEAGEVIVWRGDIFVTRQKVEPGLPTTLLLEVPPRLRDWGPVAPWRQRYSPELWRIEFSRCFGVIYSVEAYGCSIRPAKADEVPARCWLAYGSSITHADARGHVAQAARMLGVDALNKGLAGSCHAEKETADYFLSGEKWDFCTAELGVNMRDAFTEEAFAERVSIWLETIHQGSPGKPLGVITPYTNAQHQPLHQKTTAAIRQQAYSETLRQWVRSKKNPNVCLFEGTQILNDFTLLSSDLIHPSESGQTHMAHHLTRMLLDAGMLSK